jgi:hypothetical protein
MNPFPNYLSSTGAGDADHGGRDAGPLAAPPGGDPVVRGLFHARDWQPVPFGYDWYGATDPEGLVDDPQPLGPAPRPPAPPAVAP